MQVKLTENLNLTTKLGLRDQKLIGKAPQAVYCLKSRL